MEASNTTVAGQSTLSASATLGDAQLVAPDLHLGQFTDTGVQLGVGDSGLQEVAVPSAVSDAVATATAVSETLSPVADLVPDQVVEALPASGQYSTTRGNAGASVDWDYA